MNKLVRSRRVVNNSFLNQKRKNELTICSYYLILTIIIVRKTFDINNTSKSGNFIHVRNTPQICTHFFHQALIVACAMTSCLGSLLCCIWKYLASVSLTLFVVFVN